LAEVLLYQGDAVSALRTMPSGRVSCCVTSPPYFGLRDYGHPGQIGLEKTPEEFVAKLVEVFREVHRVLRDDGTLWVNIGDSYAKGGVMGKHGGERKNRDQGGMNVSPRHIHYGVKNKDLIGVPWMLAFALRQDGWYLRQDIIWSKPNPTPESVTDRCTKAHEYLFLFSKSPRYYFDHEAISEKAVTGRDLGLLRGRQFADSKKVAHHADSIRLRQANGVDSRSAGDGTRNKRSVWTVKPAGYEGAHFAVMPEELVRPCVLAGAWPSGKGGKECDCDTVIETPTGTRKGEDLSRLVGRAGFSRVRADLGGRRAITRWEQRHEAEQIKASAHYQAMRRMAGLGFPHYVRTDLSGARPLPEHIRQKFRKLGWLKLPPPCPHERDCPPGVVLDPFAGTGTVLKVAADEGRRAVGIELNPVYCDMLIGRLKPYIVKRKEV